MTRRNLTLAAGMAGAAAVLVLAAGCSAPSEDDLGSSTAAQTPSDVSTTTDLGDTCVRLFKRHESVRPIDMQQGVIRWGCADVPGVTDPDLGQEYCEYEAVQNGKPIKKASDLTTGPVTCVFTSVFMGAGLASTLRPAMADPANLGTAATADAIVQMQHGFNTRDAATGLISDCSGETDSLQTRLRKAACYQAYAAGGANQAQLKTLCNQTISDSTWAQAQQLGAKMLNPGDDGYDAQRDIAGCMAVRGAGVSWRNSDPMICSRASRTASECSCEFNAVPSALPGIPFTGWVDDQIPSSCRLAKVSGAPYPYLALCQLTDQEVSDLPLNPQYSRSVANFCHDRFGVDLVMKLPLRALQQSGSCQQSAGFCAEYMSSSTPPPAQPTPPGTTREATGGSRRTSN
jgi:hypothetical protein